jgi:hypothetical protein
VCRRQKKAVIDDRMLNNISKSMEWNYLPAEGTAGGILLGFRSSIFEVISWQNFKFCSTAIVRNIGDKVTWRFVTVYGSPYEENKLNFLAEMDLVMPRWQGREERGGREVRRHLRLRWTSSSSCCHVIGKEMELHGGVFVEVRRPPRGGMTKINEASRAERQSRVGAEWGRLVCCR